MQHRLILRGEAPETILLAQARGFRSDPGSVPALRRNRVGNYR